jgi:membrane-associated phospholipid phosphatase
MTLKTLLSTILIALTATFSIAQPSNLGRSADTYSNAVATEWMSLALTLTQQTPGFSPPVAARAFGYLGVTLYEAMVPGMPGYLSLTGQLNELNSLPVAQPDEPLHWPTVANAALSTMTRMMFSNASSDNKGRIDQLERLLPLKYGQDFNPDTYTPEIINRSNSFGKLMAMAVMTWARTDGGHEAWGPVRRGRAIYVPPSGTGLWAATPAQFQKALLPYWGENRPFVLKDSKECKAPPPPEYSEDKGSPFYKAAKEVYDIRTNATQEQRQFAFYWADDPSKTPTPAGHWVHITNDLLKNRKANLFETAQAFARLNIAMSDAFVAAWQTKYALNVVRPVTYIQGVFDSNWTTQIETPPFPEYPSGHSIQSASAANVLEHIFGANTSFTDNAHNDRGWGPRTFPSFRVAAEEAALSRLYAGIHYRFGVEGGQVQGKCVAAKVLALKFKTN